MSNVIPFRYKDQAVHFQADGWINATEAARHFGKRPIDWLRQDETQAYIAAMAEALGMSKVSQAHFGLVRTSRGGKAPGTWLHPKLAVRFAQWLDVRFAVWCDLQLDALLHGEVPARVQFDRACKALADGQAMASLSGKQLAEWRWRKPGLEREVEHWRDELQMTLGLEAA